MSLSFDSPGDIIDSLSPYTQHLTELAFSGKLPNNMEPFFNGISTHYPMLEDLSLYYALTPEELLPLVENLPKLGKLAKLILYFGREFLKAAKSLLVLDYLRSCPLLTELTLRTPMFHVLEMPSNLFSSLEPLLVGKLKVLALESIALNTSAAKALHYSLQSQHCSLVTLTLEECRFISNASMQLAIGIGRNTSLHRTVFRGCQLGSEDFTVLTDTLRDNKTLKEVKVWQSSRAMVINKPTVQELKQCNQNITFKLDFY